MSLVNVSIALPAAALGQLYAFLASTCGTAVASQGAGNSTTGATAAPTPVSAAADTPANVQAATGAAPVSSGDGERDAAGVLWDEAKHASTKGKTKAGLWRMKVGVTRPAGEGEDAIQGNAGSAAAPDNSASGTPAPASSTAAPAADEDDEFAAFRNAAAAQGAAPAPARTWTDADLSKLCNQGAIAAGGPDQVKAIIAKYVPAGQPQHSRSIPNEQRETFAQDVEKSLGIQYAG